MEMKNEIPRREMVDAIQSCIRGIDNQLTQTNSLEFTLHMTAVRQFLKDSLYQQVRKDEVLQAEDEKEQEKQYNIAKIHHALSYIETILVKPMAVSEALGKKGMFAAGKALWGHARKQMGIEPEPNEKIRTKFQQSKLPVMLESAQSEIASPTAISFEEHQFLGRIHLTLREQLQVRKQLAYLACEPSQKVVDTYSYPVENDGQVMNDGIGIWQRGQMILADAVHQDFTRNVSVRGFFAKNQKEVTELLDDLLNSSAYNEEEKLMIRTWLLHNGGQGNIMPQFLLATGEYTGNNPTDVMKATSLTMDWCITNGRCVMNVDLIYPALRIRQKDGVEKTLGFKDGVLNHNLEPEDVKQLTTPLLRCQYQIELNVRPNAAREQVVTPLVTSLKATRYTEALSFPEQSNQMPQLGLNE